VSNLIRVDPSPVVREVERFDSVPGLGTIELLGKYLGRSDTMSEPAKDHYRKNRLPLPDALPAERVIHELDGYRHRGVRVLLVTMSGAAAARATS